MVRGWRVNIYRIVDGKVVEGWSVTNSLDLFKQLALSTGKDFLTKYRNCFDLQFSMFACMRKVIQRHSSFHIDS